MEITTFKALDRYYRTLGMTGYESYGEVKGLLLLSFLERYTNDENTNKYITEKDFRTIRNVLNCLYVNHCMIDHVELDKCCK